MAAPSRLAERFRKLVTIGFTCNVTRDFQFNPAIYFSNDDPSRVMGYIVFTYTFHLWGDKNDNRTASAK